MQIKKVLANILFSVFLISAVSFVSKSSFAFIPISTCAVRTNNDMVPCMVVNDPAYANYKSNCTLKNITNSINSELIACLSSVGDETANVIVFQPNIETEYSGRPSRDQWNNIVNNIDESTETVIAEPISIRLLEGQILVIAGYIAPWAKGYSPFVDGEGGGTFGFDTWNDYETIDLIDPTGATLTKHINYKAKITVKDIPQNRAAFEISGKGIVIFKDIKIDAKCGDPNKLDDDPDNDYMVCGPIIKLSGGAVVNFMKSHINVAEGYEYTFEATNSGDQTINPFMFVQDYFAERSSAAKTVVWSHSAVTYKFDKPRVLETRNFAYAKFESIGVIMHYPRRASRNIFWEDHQDFIETSGIRTIDCVRHEFSSCVISNLSDFRVDESMADKIFYIERTTGDIKSGGALTRNDDETYTLAFTDPKYLDKSNYYIMTNNGQHLRVSEFACPADSEIITSDDGSVTCSAPLGSSFEGGTFVCTDELADYNSATGRCVCKAETNTALNSSGECMPKPRYEWANGDESSGQAYPECRGDAFPVNDSTERSERCQCADGEFLTWSSGGISRCGRIMMMYGPVMSRYGSDSSGSSSDRTPVERSDSSADSDDSGDDVRLSDEETCLESGGSWQDRGLLGGTCDYPQTDESSVDADSEEVAGGCSLVTTGGPQTPIVFIVLLGLTMVVILKKRGEKLH